MPTKSTSNILIVTAFVLILWIGSYAALSRRGHAEADQWNSEGFYYFTPENTDAWRWSESSCACLFWPLNVIDRSIGLGRGHCAAPMWDLD